MRPRANMEQGNPELRQLRNIKITQKPYGAYFF